MFSDSFHRLCAAVCSVQLVPATKDFLSNPFDHSKVPAGRRADGRYTNGFIRDVKKEQAGGTAANS